MKTRTMKILVTLVSVLIMVAMLGSVVFATTPADLKPNAEDTEGITELGQKLMGILSTIGIVLAVLVLMVLGIKYMMGSAEEKAEYKKTMMPYIVGAALIFAASALAQVIYQFFTGVSAS